MLFASDVLHVCILWSLKNSQSIEAVIETPVEGTMQQRILLDVLCGEGYCPNFLFAINGERSRGYAEQREGRTWLLYQTKGVCESLKALCPVSRGMFLTRTL